ncbi:MAG: type IV conjugative transfer system coupling protein TraD [Gammaproteobacteria bacterium]
MSMQTPLEGLLRPPLEWITSTATFLTSLLLISHPTLFLLSNNLAYGFASALVLFGCSRFKQGYRVWRYQRNLKCMPTYTITSTELPLSKEKLFLGKGFAWTAQHTQRLRDLDLDYNLHFKFPSKLKKWAREKEFLWENKSTLKKIARLFKKDHWLSPFRPYPEIGGEPCIHGVSDKEQDVAINLVERASHLLVLGLPGVGKTRFAELVISQDIHRGDVVIVLDPKGDADLLRRIYIEAKLAGREQDLLIFHLGFPEQSCRYNPIGNFTRVTEVANRISNQLPSSGEAVAFKEFGWQFINSIAMALVAMGEKPDYQKVKFYITKMDLLLERYLEYWLPQIDPGLETWVNEYIKNNASTKQGQRLKGLVAYVQQHQLIENPIFDDLHNACRYDSEYFSKITAALGPLLKKLTTGKSAELLSPDYNDINDERPILDWLQAIHNKQIVYVGLDSLTDPVVAAAVGNAMFSDLVSIAGRLYNTGLESGYYETQEPQPLPRVCLHSDEFNEIIGDEFIPLLNKSRGAGFTVTAYTQTWSDVEARLKSTAKAGQVAGNIGTVVMFRCKEAATVEMFLGQLPMVPILRVLPASSSSDTSHGEDGVYYRSNNEDRFAHSEQRLIEQNDVLNLPKGQAFCLLEGGKLHKLRMPLPKHAQIQLPKNIETLLVTMRKKQKKIT